MTRVDYGLGCQMPVADWVHLNRIGVFADPALREYVAPFPPRDLMHNVSGLTSEADFASHGADFFVALSQASPRRLTEFRRLLDFGCGCGRLARMLKGHPYDVSGCDIDRRHVEWVRKNLSYMDVKLSPVRPPIPFHDAEFDAIISISVFSHLNERSQDEFLAELSRVCKPAGHLFITVHGPRALHRAITETPIRDMLCMPDDLFQAAQVAFAQGRHAFIRQEGHLTTRDGGSWSLKKLVARKAISTPFEYGITFLPEGYVRQHWARWFEVLDYRSGALHDFQDIVVLTPKK